jgi:hypothetical protein
MTIEFDKQIYIENIELIPVLEMTWNQQAPIMETLR